MARIARLYDYKGSIGVKFRRYNIAKSDETYLCIGEFYRRLDGRYFLRGDRLTYPAVSIKLIYMHIYTKV